MSDVFGPIFTGSEPEQAVIEILKKWYLTYIRELQVQIGWTGNSIPEPRSYTTRTRVEHYSDDQLPQCVVVSPGLYEPPKKIGGGTYRGTWMIGVGVIVSGQDEPSTKALARFYAAATRAILIQHPSLDNRAIGLEWVDESYDDIPDDADTRRVVASGTVYFRIEFEDIGTWPGGPRVPLPPIPPGDPYPGETRWPVPDPINQPGSHWPDAETVTVTLTREAL